MIPEIALSIALSMTPSENKVLNYLTNRLERDGYDISAHIEDSRFEIYSFKRGGKFTNYADTTQSWYMKSDSIEKCADFIDEYWYWLKKAEEEFGPSPEHITSQLQLETNRGQYTGERPLFNSFISVYIDRPDRRREFYRYLTDFLDIFADTTDNIVYPKDIFDVKGFWAGAHGFAQGMPDMIEKYGKDFDGDGVFDPMNMPDAIGFMSRYLADHGFGKDPSGATQKYNKGHPFYGSAIGKHTTKLKDVMNKRIKIPPRKLKYINNVKIVSNHLPRGKLR